LIIVDVSASTRAFVGTVCLLAVRRSVSGRDEGSYQLSVTLPHLRHPVRHETERRTIRQTVPTKAPVEAKTSTIINKRLFFFKKLHFELAYR